VLLGVCRGDDGRGGGGGGDVMGGGGGGGGGGMVGLKIHLCIYRVTLRQFGSKARLGHICVAH